MTPAPSVKVKNAKLRAARYFAFRGGGLMVDVADVVFGVHPSRCYRRMIKVAMKKRLHEVVHGKNPKKDVPLPVSDCPNYVRPILPPKGKWN